MTTNKNLRTIRRLILLFMTALFFSGLTAMPVDSELQWLLARMDPQTSLYQWLHKVYSAYTQVKAEHPFLLYGYDWLAFAHFVLAILFIGPYRDPVRNVWVIQFGLIACALIPPFAFATGAWRAIPFTWQLIDCSFGVIGAIPLWICLGKIKALTRENLLKARATADATALRGRGATISRLQF